MRCTACGHENRAAARFCKACGTELAYTCARCGTKLRPAARFCDACGQRVVEPADTGGKATAPSAPLPPVAPQPMTVAVPLSYTPAYLADKILRDRAALEGERKQVTVLFCDFANSTSLAARLGPEGMHGLLNRFFETALAGIHRYEGTVNQFLGDGF